MVRKVRRHHLRSCSTLSRAKSVHLIMLRSSMVFLYCLVHGKRCKAAAPTGIAASIVEVKRMPKHHAFLYLTPRLVADLISTYHCRQVQSFHVIQEHRDRGDSRPRQHDPQPISVRWRYEIEAGFLERDGGHQRFPEPGYVAVRRGA